MIDVVLECQPEIVQEPVPPRTITRTGSTRKVDVSAVQDVVDKETAAWIGGQKERLERLEASQIRSDGYTKSSATRKASNANGPG